MRKLQTYSTGEITVTFDPNVCTHSAVCLRALPAVFDVRRRRWIRPELAAAAEVAATVARCPSGALRSRVGGVSAESVADDSVAGVRIQASSEGPLHVEGEFSLLDEAGREIPHAGRAALCRCGGSRRKPFCDGSHRDVGFRG